MQAAKALPRKSFFVDMLTRDIELQDVLLDLLDNCVDGILRSTVVDMTSAQPYRGFHAVITVSEAAFRITDNCGGIPINIAIEKAFAIGRPDPIEGEEAIATVGKYGIGMKRAIFKLGREAKVRSWSDEPFEVRISPEWMRSDDWDDLPLQKLMPGVIPNRGTSIEVTRLDPAVAKVFARKEFVEEFKRVVARQYSIIIGKGFSVSIAHTEANVAAEMLKPVPAEPFELLTSDPVAGGKERIAPFIYEGMIDGVAIEIYAGLYRRLPTDEEREQEEETKGQTDDAGWTVACNDRIVIWKDRGRLTGWGEASVPNYHGQFIAITGIVLMHAENLDKLPLTTTKRGIDAGSDVYSKCKDLMREATKHLASFTNKWKNHADELETIYRGSRQMRIPDLKAEAAQLRTSGAMSAVRAMPSVARRIPALPEPTKVKSHARVGFNAPKTDIVTLAIAYFDDASAKPGAVGEQAFVRELARVGRS